MTAEQIRQAWKTEPFRAFAIRLADRRSVEVNHPHFFVLSPSGQTAIVCQHDDSLNMIDVTSVKGIEVL